MAAGLSAQVQAMPAGIPIVDLGGLYADDPAAKKAVAAKIGAACDEIGFFYAVNHNVPVETIDRARAAVDRFFSLPLAEKLKVECDKNNRGYRKVGDTIHANGKASARDSFDLGFPVTEDDPEVKAGTPLYAPNQWPELPGFREALEAYYDGTYRLGMKILEGFALHFGKAGEGRCRELRHRFAALLGKLVYGCLVFFKLVPIFCKCLFALDQ